MTLVNSYPPVSTQSSYPQTELEKTDLKKRKEEIYQRTRKDTFSLAEKYLDSQIHPLHDDTEEAMGRVLKHVDQLYKEIFPNSSDQVNASYDSYTFLDSEKDTNEIKRMFEKAKTLYVAYREQCIDEALLGLPAYIQEKCNLKQEDLPILTTMMKIVSRPLKEKALYPRFDLFHQLCGLRVIHYYLRIPRSIPNSDTFFVIRHLPFKES